MIKCSIQNTYESFKNTYEIKSKENIEINTKVNQSVL